MTGDGGARGYLCRPGLERLWVACRERCERNGAMAGRVHLRNLSDREAHDIAGLLGGAVRRLPDPGGDLAVAVSVVDRALRASRFELGVIDALEIVGGPLRSLPDERARERADREAFWDQFVVGEGMLGDWFSVVRSTGALARLARRDGGAPLRRALAVAGRVPFDPPMLRTALAADVAGDPHALDDGAAAGALTLQALAWLAGAPAPGDARGRRGLWERFGVVCDDVSSTVLALNVPVVSGPVAATFAAWAGRPVSLTLEQVTAGETDVPAGTVVFCCENPSVLRAAADEMGARCAPMVCVSGQPSVAVLALLERLHAAGARLLYHGDYDVGGLRVADRVASAVAVEPWRYDADCYRAAVDCGLGVVELAERPVSRVFAELADAVAEVGVAVYEEQVLDDLLADLRGAPRCRAVPRVDY